jgi:hypothetical protein
LLSTQQPLKKTQSSLLVVEDAVVDAAAAVELREEEVEKANLEGEQSRGSVTSAAVLGRTTLVSNITRQRLKSPVTPISTLPLFSKSPENVEDRPLRQRRPQQQMRMTMDRPTLDGQSVGERLPGFPDAAALGFAIHCDQGKTQNTYSVALLSAMFRTFRTL